MTRKHFKIIAAEVANISDPVERQDIANIFADICKAGNARFDRQRFMAACGL
jgi:hypothetical protein